MKAAITGVCVLGPWGQQMSHFRSFCDNPNSLTSTFIPDLDYFEIVGTKNKRTKKIDRLSKLVSIAAKLALEDAQINKQSIESDRGAIVTGSALGAMDSIFNFNRELETLGPSAVNPNIFPPTSHNVAGGHLSIEFGFSGPLIHFASGRSSSEQALLYSYDLLALSRADVVITGAWEILCNDYLESLKKDSPKTLPREAIVICILESRQHAIKRSAPVKAWLTGGRVWNEKAQEYPFSDIEKDWKILTIADEIFYPSSNESAFPGREASRLAHLAGDYYGVLGFLTLARVLELFNDQRENAPSSRKLALYSRNNKGDCFSVFIEAKK